MEENIEADRDKERALVLSMQSLYSLYCFVTYTNVLNI